MSGPDSTIESDAEQPENGPADSTVLENADDGARRKPPNAGMGRKKGVPNRVGRDLRKTIEKLLQANAPEVQGWFDRVAKKNPARALDLWTRLNEFVLPKLKAIEVSPGPRRMSRQSLFGISFDNGGPGQGEAADGEIEVSGPEGGVDTSPRTLEADAQPASLPEPHSLAVHAPLPSADEAPRVTPDPERPDAVVIDAGSGTIWEQIGGRSPSPAEVRAAAVTRSREALERRRREHEERNNRESEVAREAGRIRAAKMGPAE